MTINKFCTPHIQTWWLDTQDELVRDGTRIREELARRIQADIQQISKELSDYLGDALQVELNINSIQFPSFDFAGIDAQIKRQQERVITIEKRKEIEHRLCNSDRVYYVDVPVEEKRSVFEVDLHQIAEAIKQKIDEQVDKSEELLQRVIEKQVSEDFRSAEQQINDYINRFQAEFDRLLRERETKEAEADHIRATLEAQKVGLNEYLRELTSIRESLDSWKPVQTSQVGC